MPPASTPRSTRPTSLRVDAGRLARMRAMTADEPTAAARRGELSLGEMLQWAARRPAEVPLVDGKYFFISALSADCEGPEALTSDRLPSRPCVLVK